MSKISSFLTVWIFPLDNTGKNEEQCEGGFLACFSEIGSEDQRARVFADQMSKIGFLSFSLSLSLSLPPSPPSAASQPHPHPPTSPTSHSVSCMPHNPRMRKGETKNKKEEQQEIKMPRGHSQTQSRPGQRKNQRKKNPHPQSVVWKE